MTISEALEIARQRIAARQLAEAEAILRQIHAQLPDQAKALHLLGVVAYLRGQHEAAVAWLKGAITSDPAAAHFRNSLGLALHDLRCHGEAVDAFRNALRLDPQMVEAMNGLGNALREAGQREAAMEAFRTALRIRPEYVSARMNLGIVLMDAGRAQEAVAEYRRVLAMRPDEPMAHSNLGIALLELNEPEKALNSIRTVLKLEPAFPQAHFHLGLALERLGKLEPAREAYRCAIQLQPDQPQAYNNLGTTLFALGRFQEALPEFAAALRCDPHSVQAHNNTGNALRRLGELNAALAAYRAALACDPRRAETHHHLGVVLRDLGALDEAVEACRSAWHLRPNFPEALNALGNALGDRGDNDEAIEAYRKAVSLAPGFAEAWSNLGTAHKNAGQVEKAIEALTKAVELDPRNAAAHSNLIYTLHFHPAGDQAAIEREMARWNQRHAEPLRSTQQPPDGDRNPARRLRIGYVSPDFRDHVVGRNVLPLLEGHDRNQVEVICYSDVLRRDWITDRFEKAADHWRQIAGVPDAELAETICADRVDLLVDLTLHMAGNRLQVLARKPAPVQVSFAGYPGATGLPAIAYRISDRFLEPGDAEPMVALIDSFWCYDPLGEARSVSDLPAFTHGGVTFGCLNNFCKMNERTLSLWARVLQEVGRSRLVLLTSTGSHRQQTLEFLKRQGVEAARVEFVSPCARPEYLGIYHRLDLALDTFPYNGHTTSLDALWMGVPVISLAGTTPLARAGLSICANLRMPEFLAESEDEYVARAAELAADLSGLAEWRRTLRERMSASILMNRGHFSRSIEGAYRQLWHHYCARAVRQTPP